MKTKELREIIVFICMFWPGNHLVCANPCTTFTELSSASKRDPDYQVDSVPVCDRILTPGWYKVKDSVMSTSAPQLGRCGSVYPIWLNGNNPETAGNVVTSTACQVGFSSPCENSYTIEVEKCPNGDTVYKLQPPSLCSSAYCFENVKQNTCITETVTAVEVVYHNTTWEEKNSTQAGDYYDPVIHFVCQFTPINDGDLYYTIEWFIENERVDNYTVDGSTIDQLTFTTVCMLEENKRMGEKIQCAVGAKKAQNDTACVFQSSTQFLVGFEVLNTTLTIERDGSAQILLKQNIPYVPRTFPYLPGVAELKIQTKYTNTPAGTACGTAGYDEKCEITVNGYHYLSRDNYADASTWNKIHSMSISSLDPLDYYIQTSRLVLRLGTLSTGHPFFNNVDFPDINVNIVEDGESWKGERCSSYADPHMTSFDGYAYECQKDGCITGITYILYQNIRHRQEVQVRHGSCWGNPRCVCAVSARSGRDVFVVDFCDGREFINFPLCGDNSLQVFREGDRTYRVFLATGTSVKITIYRSGTLWYINVEIYPTVADENSTSGLCGYLDGDKSNDLRWKNGIESDISLYNYYYTHPNDFAKSWRLPTGSTEDLLEHDGAIYDSLDSLDNYVHKLCSCDNATGVVCSYKRYQDCTTVNRGTPLACTLQTSNRRKRDIRKHQERALLMKSETRYQRAKRQTTISQEDATLTCTRAFENSAHYDICLTNIPNFGNESLINCINDLVLTGNENLTQLHLETALSQCKEYISYNSTLQTEQSDIVYKIIILCSNNCSNRGICNDGNCTCDPGFGGSDCSFDLSAPPTITHISDAGLCDRTTEVCDDIAIYGRYFVQNPDSACHMMRSEVNGSGAVSVEDSYHAPLIQRTLFEAECPLKYNTNDTWVTEFVFNVTNDGSQFTEKFTVYVYQSACQIFNNDSGTIYFTLQEHYCYISGVCVPDGTVQSNGSCLQCDRKTHAYDWINVCTTSTAMTTATSQEVPSSITQTTVSPTGTSTTSVSTGTSTTSVSSGTSTTSVSSGTSTTSVSSGTSTTSSSSGTSTTSASTGTTASTSVSNGASETPTIFPEASETTTATKTTTQHFSATTSTTLTSKGTTATQVTTTKVATETQTTPGPTSKTTTHLSVNTHPATTLGPDEDNQGDSGADNNSQTGVIVGASIGSLVAVVVVVTAGIMLKKKFTKRESISAPNVSTEDFNIYPDRNTVSRDKFDATTNLFSFSSPGEMYSRPLSATSMRKGSATVDLSRFYNSQHLDSLFTAKK